MEPPGPSISLLHNSCTHTQVPGVPSAAAASLDEYAFFTQQSLATSHSRAELAAQMWRRVVFPASPACHTQAQVAQSPISA